jgi:hypothetical protein
MLARLLIFVGIPLTLLPLVFRFAVFQAVDMADHQHLAAGVGQYAAQSSGYLLVAVNIGLVVGLVPLVLGIVLLLRERMRQRPR